MNEQNKKQIKIMAVLGVILLGVLYYQFFVAGKSKTPAAKGAATKTAAPPAGAGAAFPGAGAAAGAPAVAIEHTDVDVKALLASLQQEPLNYKEVRIQRDPMKPLVGKVTNQKGGGVTEPGAAAAGQPGDVLNPQQPDAKQQKIISVQGRRITAIVWDAHNPVAVVDDEVVSVGYTYPDGVRVDAIEPSHVVFKVDDQQISVEMKEK